MEDHVPSLRELVSLEDYQQANARVFPSIESMRWYVRQHRNGLLACGALLFIGGRNWVSPMAFDRYAVDVGQRAARLRAAGKEMVVN